MAESCDLGSAQETDYGMQAIWRFLSDPSNQRTLGFIGTALAVVVGAAWAVLTYLYPPQGVGADEIDVTPERYLAMTRKIEKKVEERYKEKLEAARENTDLATEVKRLYVEEVQLLKTRLEDREKAVASLKKTLPEASATLTASPEGFSRSEIETANKQIKNGNPGAATKLLEKAAARASSEAAEAEFLLGKLAESQVDIEKAARHFRRAVLINRGNREYRDYENKLYNVTVVFDSGMRDRAKTIASTLSDAGFPVRTKHWLDYREDDDGAMYRWIRRSTFLYGTHTDRSKVTEIEQTLAKAGIKLEADHIHGILRKHNTEWSFGVLNVFLWLPGPDSPE